MYVTNITVDCTSNENIIDIFIPTWLLTVPCGQSFLCLTSLMVYTLFKPLKNKWWRNFCTQLIQFDVR